MWGAPPMVSGVVVGDAEVMRWNISQLLEHLGHLAGATYPIQARLVDCERCGSDFVNPVAWHEQGETHWWMRLRCGQCGVVREVEVSNEEAERFDRELDRLQVKIAAAVARLDRERMIADCHTLTVALERDLIDPCDFYR
jgi:ribosomal protein S27AE